MLQTLNCTNSCSIEQTLCNCTFSGKPIPIHPMIISYFALVLVLSAICLVMSSISSVIFTFYIKEKILYLQFLRLYSITILCMSLNDFIVAILKFSVNDLVYDIDRKIYNTNYLFHLYFMYFSRNYWRIFALFVMILEIYIIYEKICMFKPKWKLKKIKTKKIKFKYMGSHVFDIFFFDSTS